MAHRGQPAVAVVGSRCAVEGDALAVHVHAQHRHVVFPADHRADTAVGGVHRLHGGAVAEAPDQALARGGHEFAVLADQALVAAEIERRAVQRAAIALDAAHHHDRAGVGDRFVDDFDFLAVEADGLAVIGGVGVAAGGLAQADGAAEAVALGVATQKGFGEHLDLGTVAGGLADERGGLERALDAVGGDGCSLNHGGLERLGACCHVFVVSRRSGWQGALAGADVNCSYTRVEKRAAALPRQCPQSEPTKPSARGVHRRAEWSDHSKTALTDNVDSPGVCGAPTTTGAAPPAVRSRPWRGRCRAGPWPETAAVRPGAPAARPAA